MTRSVSSIVRTCATSSLLMKSMGAVQFCSSVALKPLYYVADHRGAVDIREMVIAAGYAAGRRGRPHLIIQQLTVRERHGLISRAVDDQRRLFEVVCHRRRI